MDSNRQDPSGTPPSSRGGRTRANTLRIDWQARIRTIWEAHPDLRRTIGQLQDEARRIDAFTTNEYEDFRRKFNGTRAASEAHARALFQAGQIDRAGLTFEEWIADDAEWEAIAATLSPIDAVGFLTKRAAYGTMAVVPASETLSVLPKWRRLRDGDPAEVELTINEYLALSATFPGSEDANPVYLLAVEWSPASRDWQIFNLVKGSLLDIAVPVPVMVQEGRASAKIAVGVQIVGPPAPFDLFVLGQRTPFHHRARSMLDNLGGRSIITPIEMGRLLGVLFSRSLEPDVASISYRVV